MLEIQVNMENKDNEIYIKNQADVFVKVFRNFCTEELQSRYKPKPALDVTEMTDDNIRDAIVEFFNKKTLSDAKNHMYDVIGNYIDDSFDKVDRSKSNYMETPEYRQWRRYSDIRDTWNDTARHLDLDTKWVEVNGKANTAEEAAKKAAEKWCELIFGWHLQDNGAINEDHAGGFYACALGTILADKCKKGITEDVKKKAYDLLYEYYYRMIHYANTYDEKDIDWLVENLPDDDEKNPFDWKYFKFRVDLYCDYGPGTPLYLILVNAGVDKKDVNSICPWKTGISIRTLDNAVQYHTYQHLEEL